MRSGPAEAGSDRGVAARDHLAVDHTRRTVLAVPAHRIAEDGCVTRGPVLVAGDALFVPARRSGLAARLVTRQGRAHGSQVPAGHEGHGERDGPAAAAPIIQSAGHM